MLDMLRNDGLHLTDYEGARISCAPDDLVLTDDPRVLREADIVLVCVKSAGTAQMAALLGDNAPDGAVIVSLQNGMGHAATLAAALPDHDIRPAMVPFNIVPMGQGRFHRATSGDIVIGDGPMALDRILGVAGMAATQSAEIEAIQWGKFLLNLNNAPNALSGLTLHAQLLSRPWRRLMADQIAEALVVLRAHRCTIRATTPVPVGLMPHVLRLPTPLFRRVAAKTLTIDPQARTSMAHDLIGGRPTEIDALQGLIIEMGQQKSLATPICSAMHKAVKRAERDGFVPQPPEALRG